MKEVSRTLAELFEPNVVVEAARPEDFSEQLFPEERAHVASALPRRQAEFATARVLARRALAKLGAAACDLTPHPDRRPRWPRGIVGSISHTKTLCVVAVAREESVQSLGVDVEEDDPLEREMAVMIAGLEEAAWLDAQEDSGRAGRLLFTLKEAFYKCQYPLTRTFLEFDAVQVQIKEHREDMQAGRYSVFSELLGTDIVGRYRRIDSHLAAVAWLPQETATRPKL